MNKQSGEVRWLVWRGFREGTGTEAENRTREAEGRGGNRKMRKKERGANEKQTGSAR